MPASAPPGGEEAIAAALVRDWKKAVAINTRILAQDKKNIEALNRLGFALLMSGKLAAAKRAFQSVTRLDPYNKISIKNLQKLSLIRQKYIVNTYPSQISPLVFLEEPGKTKLVDCVNLAPLPALSPLSPGQDVVLRPKNHVVELRTTHNTYLGALPDDLSFKLLKLMAAGNRYQCVVKSVGKNKFTVLLREISRGKRFAHQPSFTTASHYLPYTRESTRSGDTPDVTPTGEKSEEKTAKE